MEYLLVEFCERRGVLIDDVQEGFTNEVIELEAGNHEISLAEPRDFTPERREIYLRRTTSTNPRVVHFDKV